MVNLEKPKQGIDSRLTAAIILSMAMDELGLQMQVCKRNAISPAPDNLEIPRARGRFGELFFRAPDRRGGTVLGGRAGRVVVQGDIEAGAGGSRTTAAPSGRAERGSGVGFRVRGLPPPGY